MFAIPRHNSLQVYDNAQDAIFYERTDLTVYQIQDLQIDSLVLGPKGGTFALLPNGKTSFTGDIKMLGKRHFPAIFELTSHKRSEVTVILPKNTSHPWLVRALFDFALYGTATDFRSGRPDGKTPW